MTDDELPMITEVILDEVCERLALRFGLGDLCAEAQAQHARKAAVSGAWTPMTILRAFLFYQPDGPEGGGHCAVLFAFAGTGSQETEGYEGLLATYSPGELPAALAAIAEASAAYDEQFIADDLAERIRQSAAEWYESILRRYYGEAGHEC